MMQRRRLALIAAASLLDRRASSQTTPTLRISGPSTRDVQAVVAQRLLGEVYRQSDLGMEMVAMPPARSKLAIQSGHIDGELMRTHAYGQLYPELLRVAPAYYRVAVHAFSLQTRQIEIRGREDLALYSLGALRGVSYVPTLVAGHRALTLASIGGQLLQMLRAGRVDMALDGLLSGRVELARLGLTEAVRISPELGRFELLHYLRPDRQAVAGRLGATIQRMRTGGELPRLTALHEMTVLAEHKQASSNP